MASVHTVTSNAAVLEKMTIHLNYLLQRQSGQHKEAVSIMNKMFLTAEEAMESENDKQVLVLLKTYVSCLIGSSLGISRFLPENHPKEDMHNDEHHISWSTIHHPPTTTTEIPEEHSIFSTFFSSLKKTYHAPELAEHARLAQLAEEYNDHDQEDSDREYVSDNDVPKSRDMNGFQTVRRQRVSPNSGDYGGGRDRFRNNRSCVKPKYFQPHRLERLSSEAYCIPVFFPSENSYQAFISALGSAKSSLLVCVFSLTDDNTADILIDAKQRGVDVRIITDNDQLTGKGADVLRLQRDYGIPYKTDDSEQFMHNKFAVIDGRIVITGSFNWSIGARFKNRENVVITNIPSVVEPFSIEFERLWDFF
ncbi:hypothetical protein BDF14DRAFT_1889253 [Spinellus fusiger]|nr:hypothetical protein BDF14DRAFT_1889253 [Spinellus fusiger]